MKKLIFFLLFVFIYNTTFAQNYKISIKNYVYDVYMKDAGCKSYRNRVKITVFFSNGESREIYNGNAEVDVDFASELISVTESRKPIRINYYAFTKEKKGRNGCDGDSEMIDDNISIPNYNCISGHHYNGPDGGQAEITVNFDYEIQPIINLITPTANLIGLEDNFSISVQNNSTGYLSANYNWEYQLLSSGTPSPNNWSAMPTTTTGKSSFSIKPSSFLTEEAIGKRLYIQTRMCDNLVSENAIFYELRKSAPHISSIDPNPVRCFKEENGTAKISFDRDLIAGELLSISMTNITTGIDYSEENIDVLETGNSYTVNNLPPGDYTVRLLGAAPGYNGNIFNTYTDGAGHSASFSISEPTPVAFSFTKVNVWCNDGNDGELVITASGGQDFGVYEYLLRKVGETRENWFPFSNTATFPTVGVTETISGLEPANYELKVRDANLCEAKEFVKDGGGTIIGLGGEITEIIEITVPDAPVTINFVYHQEPSAFGFSNGRIRAKITGGTPLSNDRYNYTWKHENGTSWTTFSDVRNNDGWFLTLENAIVGTYFLTVTDVNHVNAIDKMGCTIINAEFTLNEPPLLTLFLEETKVISCNNTNTFSDPSSDGELTAKATGGVPLGQFDNNGLLYYYTWKKKDINGNYQMLVGEKSPVLSNVDTGEYAVNIMDSKGITIGTYTNNTLVAATDETYTLNQPTLLEISLDKVNVFCKAGNDGSIDATISGGTGNYSISWSNGATTEDIDTLVAGTYTVDISDERGCQAQASITINEPETPLEINYTAFFAPTFSGATNGWIEATITGGTSLNTGTYNYVWKDVSGTNLNAQVTETINATSYVITLNKLGKGVYDLTIQDKNYPLAINKTNCTIINSDYELFEPAPLIAKIVLQRPISCNSTNTYEDPFGDGVLEVIVEGGIQLQPTDNNGLSYYYTWEKETNPGVWTVLATQTTNIAMNLDGGNYAVNIEDANGIIIGVYQNNVLVNTTDVRYLFEEPSLLELDIEKQDVYCFNGSDSWAKANITGGTPPYSVLWSNGDITEQTSNLNQGIYEVSVSDSRGCHVTGSIQINQPTAPLSIDYTAFATPSTGGASDGWIEAQITGGTAFENGSYTYYWQNENGGILNAQTNTSSVNNVFQIRLNNISKGTYHLTIEDANFPLASTGDGCIISDNEFIIYDPIEAIISEHTPISCHGDNSFNNPFSDGVLQVTVTGGLPFAEGQAYIYYWKKKNETGEFDALNQNTSTLTNLSVGFYALNVEDSRGVVIGVYESLHLINPTDAVFYFQEPDLLEVSLSKTEIFCDSGNNATATVSIIGGTPPYEIQWSNGQNTETADNLIAGNYVVFITDAHGCQVTGNIGIEQPGGLQIGLLKEKHPTCFQGNDGAIELVLSGGIPPYTIAWNTGETTTDINNLAQGMYTFSLIDANGCKAFKEITLVHPAEITIDIGSDRTLCKDQTHEVDGSISDENATYSWISDTGFSATTPIITISKAGTYQVTATSSLGCTATDNIVISYNDEEIDSEFLLSSQAYVNQDVILFNVSSPKGATSKWIIPEEVAIIAKSDLSITLRFPKVATYKIGLIATQGACYEEQYKNIVVEEHSGFPSPGDTNNPFIEEFILSPNPNNGQFELYIKLAESSQIAIRVFSIQGSFIFAQPSQTSAKEYEIPMSLNLSIGTYFVVLETVKETQVKRMIVM